MFEREFGCDYGDVACPAIFSVEENGSEVKENFRSPSLLVVGGIDDQIVEGRLNWYPIEEVLSKVNMVEPQQGIKRAILEADIGLPMVRQFVQTVSEQADSRCGTGSAGW